MMMMMVLVSKQHKSNH